MRRRPAVAPYAKALFAIAKERSPATAKRAVATEVARRSGFLDGSLEGQLEQMRRRLASG